MAMSDPVNGFCNQHIIENHEAFEIKQDIIKAFYAYCKRKGFVPVSERRFVEEFKKTIHVRESRLTLYTRDNPEGDRYRVWRGVELGTECEKTVFSTEKEVHVHGVQDVQGTQTQLKKNQKEYDIQDTGQTGHESGDEV